MSGKTTIVSTINFHGSMNATSLQPGIISSTVSMHSFVKTLRKILCFINYKHLIYLHEIALQSLFYCTCVMHYLHNDQLSGVYRVRGIIPNEHLASGTDDRGAV